MRRAVRAVVLVAVLAVLVAGCSDSRPPAGASPVTASPSPGASFEHASAFVPSSSPSPDFQAAVDRFVAHQRVPFHVVVTDFASGATATHLPDTPILSASLYKLFVAEELLRRIAAGRLSAAAPAHDTTGRTIGACIEAMIVTSDNDCGVAGLTLVGGGALDTALHAQGYVSTSLATPQRTSAVDVALFLRRAHEHTDSTLYRLLQRQQVNDRLSLGFPTETPFAHKTGDRRTVAHDAGVVTTPRGDVLVVVLSGPWPLPCCDADHPGTAERTAFGAIGDLGRAVYAAAVG